MLREATSCERTENALRKYQNHNIDATSREGPGSSQVCFCFVFYIWLIKSHFVKKKFSLLGSNILTPGQSHTPFSNVTKCTTWSVSLSSAQFESWFNNIYILFSIYFWPFLHLITFYFMFFTVKALNMYLVYFILRLFLLFLFHCFDTKNIRFLRLVRKLSFFCVVACLTVRCQKKLQHSSDFQLLFSRFLLIFLHIQIQDMETSALPSHSRPFLYIFTAEICWDSHYYCCLFQSFFKNLLRLENSSRS